MASMKKEQTKGNVLLLAAVLWVLSFAVMVIALVAGGKQNQAEYTPPPFESDAVAGTPEVPESLGYSSPYQEGMGYRFSVCGNVTMDGSSAVVYFTNPAGNSVWIKLRVMDKDGNLLGETGLLKSGEYVKNVELTGNLPVGTPVKLKIMGYEPETYFSAGSATLNTAIGDVAQ